MWCESLLKYGMTTENYYLLVMVYSMQVIFLAKVIDPAEDYSWIWSYIQRDLHACCIFIIMMTHYYYHHHYHHHQYWLSLCCGLALLWCSAFIWSYLVRINSFLLGQLRWSLSVNVDVTFSSVIGDLFLFAHFYGSQPNNILNHYYIIQLVKM